MRTDTAGYSGTPLPKKLGLKAGQVALLINVPVSVSELHEFNEFARRDLTLPQEKSRDPGVTGRIYDYIHIFETERVSLQAQIPLLSKLLIGTGSLWVSWPKKASKVPTSITEDVLRDVILPLGLVDVKVCAVDNIWSGLKFMHRKELRSKLK